MPNCGDPGRAFVDRVDAHGPYSRASADDCKSDVWKSLAIEL